MERLLRYSKICDEMLPPRENPEKQTKNINFLISTSNYQRCTKSTYRYMFLWATNTMILVKNLWVSRKTSKSKMATNYGKKILLAIRRASINPNLEIKFTPLHT